MLQTTPTTPAALARRPDTAGPLAVATPTTRRLADASLSRNTRRAYLGALARLDAWRGPAPLTDARLAAYLGAIFEAGRAPATAALAVAAVRFRAKLAGPPAPAGEATARVLGGYRRTAADRGRGQAAPLRAAGLAAILATAARPRTDGRGVESHTTAHRRGRLDAVIAGLLFMGGRRRSAVAAVRWADVTDARDGDGVLLTVRTSKTNQEGDAADVRYLKNGGANAIRTVRADRPDAAPTDRVVGLSPLQIQRRFTAAARAAGIEARVTAHSGRVGLASEARRWYNLADAWSAESTDDLRAQIVLAHRAIAERMMPADLSEAQRRSLADIRALAVAGDAHAQFVLGGRYAAGRGVPQDDAEAVAWFRLAATQGHNEAQENLWVWYSTGRGVPQDDVEAVAWYRNHRSARARASTLRAEPAVCRGQEPASCSRFSSRSTRRRVSSLSVLTSIAPVSAWCSPVGSVGAIFVGASNPFNFARRPITATANRPAGTSPFENSDSAFENS